MAGSPATKEQFDLILDGDVGLMIYRDPQKPKMVDGGFISSVLGDDLQHRDVPIEQKDWSAGFGHALNVGIPNGYHWGENVNTRIPGVVIPAGELTDDSKWSFGSATGTCDADYNGDKYVFTGTGYVIKLAGKTGDPSIVTYYNGYSFTSALVWNGKLYAAAWDGVTVKDMAVFDGTTWTTVSGIPAFRICSVFWYTSDNVPLQRFFRMDTTTSFKTLSWGGTVATAGDWTSATTIGDDTFRVNKLVATSEHVYALKPDGVREIDAFGRCPNITTYWRQTADLDSGQTGVIHNGRLYATHIMGIDSVRLDGARQDTPMWSHPGHNLNNESPIRGRGTAFIDDGGWLVVAISNYDNGNSYIMYGQPKEELGKYDFPAPIVWHGAEAVIEGTSSAPRYVTHMSIVTPVSDTAQAQLLIFSTDGTTAKMHRLSIPREGNALADYASGGAHRFNSDAKLYPTRQDWGSPATKKFLWRYEIEAENVDAARQIQVYADLDEAGYVFQGEITASPRVKFNAISQTAAHIIGHRLDVTSTTEQPVKLRSTRVRAIIAQEQSDVVTQDVWFGGNISLRDGTVDRRDPEYVWMQLVALMDREPVTLTNHKGRTMTVKVLQGIPYDEKEEQADHWSRRVKLSYRVLSIDGYFDTNGDVYDSDVTYG